MKYTHSLKWFSVGLLAFLVIAQFFKIDKTNPDIEPENDIFYLEEANPNIQKLIVQACYDCHSHNSEYPWYTSIAPISWWVQGHINGGREHLNFSIWGTYSDSKKEHKFEECVEMVDNGSMPLSSYKIGHPEARLTDQERSILKEWFKSKM